VSTGSKRLFLFGGMGLAIAAVVLFAYFGTEIRANEPKASKAPALVPVSIATVRQQPMPFRVTAIGNVDAFNTVSVKARVDGQIVEVNFKEGQEVAKGSVLFRIDPRPYEAALRQAEAANARDVAARDQAQAQERRYKDLLEKNFVSKDAYAQFSTNAETASAVADGSKAAVDNARLNLEYCTIRSPIDGYTGKIQIQIGNLVKASDTNPLVVVNQVHPIYVTFAVPEQQLSLIRSSSNSGSLAVEVNFPNQAKLATTGKLSFIDNSVDPTTGTIKLRGVFANTDNTLWPGQFVNVSVKLYDQGDALIVPSQAIQNGPDGEFVFVMKPDMTVEVRKIKSDRADGENTIIASGLKGGEQVVTRGQLKLISGARVKPES
jgi:membrane fusion protein, multidrug efflux system